MRCITPTPTQVALLSSRPGPLSSQEGLIRSRHGSYSGLVRIGSILPPSPLPSEISRFQKDAYEFGTRFSDLHLYE